MNQEQKKEISRKLIRLALELRDTANTLRWSGLTEKSIEMDAAAEMCKGWAQEMAE